MNQVECYLILTRSNGIPVAGESEAIPFIGQVEISDWSWNLSPPEAEAKDGAQDAAAKAAEETVENLKKKLKTTSEELSKAVGKMKEQVGDGKMPDFAKLDKSTRETKVGEIFKAAIAGVESDDDGEDKSMEISFSKQTDFATAQMLNCMKAGEVFPLAILTVFHRSINSPLTLTIKMQKLQLMEYDLSCESTDTLTEMKETWKAQFRAFDYVYQNRPPAGMPKGITQAPAVLATQGKILPFIMLTRKKRGGGLF